jgi:hypothetical protein
MAKNIYWPQRLHWRTRKLIKEFPILRSSALIDIYFQEVILESEIKYVEWLENSEEFKNSARFYTKYKLELQYALNQLNYLG